jgi:hypothetical protein
MELFFLLQCVQVLEGNEDIFYYYDDKWKWYNKGQGKTEKKMWEKLSI